MVVDAEEVDAEVLPNGKLYTAIRETGEKQQQNCGERKWKRWTPRKRGAMLSREIGLTQITKEDTKSSLQKERWRSVSSRQAAGGTKDSTCTSSLLKMARCLT